MYAVICCYVKSVGVSYTLLCTKAGGVCCIFHITTLADPHNVDLINGFCMIIHGAWEPIHKCLALEPNAELIYKPGFQLSA